MQGTSDTWLKYLSSSEQNSEQNNGNVDTWELEAPKFCDFSIIEQAPANDDEFFSTHLESPDATTLTKKRKSLSSVKRKVFKYSSRKSFHFMDLTLPTRWTRKLKK